MNDKQVKQLISAIADRIAPLKEGESLSENLAGRIIDFKDELISEIRAGFDKVAEAIANIQPPPQPRPKMRGTIMADYQIPDNQPDGRVTFEISATDEEGVPITDPAELAKLGFEAVSSNDAAFTVTLDADQPDGAKRVGGYHVGAPGQAAVTSNLKDADGNIIGTGTDGFTVTTGAAKIGAVKSTFDGLTPIG